MYLFLSLKGRQSSILWSVLCRFHWLYHCCHSLSLIAISCHSLSLVALLVVTRCHSLSLVVILCHSLYHSLSLVVPLVVTRCTTLSHSLSLDVPLVDTRCHSLSLVITRCTTRLSFYKRSNLNLEAEGKLTQAVSNFLKHYYFRSIHLRCFVKKGVLRNFTIFTGKHLCHRFFFNKVHARPSTLLKKSLWYRSFTVNFTKSLRTPFLKNSSWRMLLLFPNKTAYSSNNSHNA